MDQYIRFFEKDYETIEKDLDNLKADIDKKRKLDAELAAKNLKVSLKAQDAKVDGDTAHYEVDLANR